VLTCWPQDGGPFVTLPLVISKDPASGEVNIGMYRMQVMGRNVTGMHWQRHKTGARHLESAKRMGKRLEVAVALGGDPALTYAATAPIPPIPGINEYSLTGYLRGRGVELVKGITVDLEVPANAEIVLEGYVDPDEDWVVEGPFGDHTGFYTLQDLYPAFHVTAITMRKDAVYPATIVGRPPMEDAYLIEASERLFLVPAQLILPEIVDYHMPPAGIAHNLVNVVIQKGYPGQAYKVGNGLLGLGQMMFAKVILVTDADVPANDHPGFWRTVLANAVPGRDHQIAKGPIDVLDHASRAWSYGSKLIVDGTVKHAEELGAAHDADAKPWQPGPERDRTQLPAHAEVLDQHQPGGGFWFLTTRKERADQGRHIGRVGRAPRRRPRRAADRRARPRDRPARLRGRDLDAAEQHRPGARRAGDRRRPRRRPGVGGRRDPQDRRRGLHAAWPDKITMTPEVRERMDALAERLGL
jgi:4-hydroxy-3-polyprenylbenzoate decarboxylase